MNYLYAKNIIVHISVYSILIIPSVIPLSYAQVNENELIKTTIKNFSPVLTLESSQASQLHSTLNPYIKYGLSLAIHFRKLYGNKLSTNSIDSTNYNYIPWESKKHLGIAVSEMAILEFLPWALAKWVRHEDWANVKPDTWWKNISKGWVYDGDSFLTNQFGHPYHGSLFFNTARSNGFSFWESVPFPFIGSLLWEYFGETFRPSINDWLNTSLSGINLGEILYRVSGMITDNTATGSERVIRELGGALMNPVRGFNRLISGETGRVFPNPKDRIPKTLWHYFYVGARFFTQIRNGITADAVNDAAIEYNLTYGDIYSANLSKPFSVFHLDIAFATAKPHLTKVRAKGNLFNMHIKKTKKVKHLFIVSLNYNYWNNPGFEFGNTQFMYHFLSSYSLDNKINISTDVALSTIVLGATKSEFFLDPEGRDYDYGPGIGFRLFIAVHSKDWIVFQARYISNWFWTVSGTLNSKHHIHLLGAQGLIPLHKNLAVGLTFAVYWRESIYPTFSNVNVTSPIGRIFLAVKI
jgi:Domain of unknown function (DUF3943)